MQITRTTDYGVRVMTHLAAQPMGTRMTVAELANAGDVSVPFAGKLLQRLVRARLVVSRRGYDGGFELGRPAGEISVLEIVSALDRPLCLDECMPGGPGCARSTWCGAHDVWRRAQESLAAVLGAETLERLAQTAARRRTQLDGADAVVLAGGCAHA